MSPELLLSCRTRATSVQQGLPVCAAAAAEPGSPGVPPWCGSHIWDISLRHRVPRPGLDVGQPSAENMWQLLADTLEFGDDGLACELFAYNTDGDAGPWSGRQSSSPDATRPVSGSRGGSPTYSSRDSSSIWGRSELVWTGVSVLLFPTGLLVLVGLWTFHRRTLFILCEPRSKAAFEEIGYQNRPVEFRLWERRSSLRDGPSVLGRVWQEGTAGGVRRRHPATRTAETLSSLFGVQLLHTQGTVLCLPCQRLWTAGSTVTA